MSISCSGERLENAQHRIKAKTKPPLLESHQQTKVQTSSPGTLRHVFLDRPFC